MATKEQLAAANLYANIMAEIKLRIAAIDAGTGGKLQLLPPPFIREFCYLQLRMICELVALGCLVGHGDIVPTKKSLQKEWSAETIVKTLDDLHPDFFPIAVRQIRGAEGAHGVVGINPPVMTKAEFLELYGRCGGVLHRGTARKLLKERMPVQINFPEITAKAQKFVDLLSIHLLVFKGGDATFICVMNNIDDKLNVQVAIGERKQPPEDAAQQIADLLKKE